MNKEIELWQKAVAFHGHTCPGLAIGYRAARIGLEKLQAERAADEELVTIVENDACGVDGVQVLTGCTMGKGNLLFRDLGKQVFTFVLRPGGRGVRVALIYDALNNSKQKALQEKVANGSATAAEKELLQQIRQERTLDILGAPVDKYFTVQQVSISLPGNARIFPSLQCSFCNEGVMEPRARLFRGAVACIDCAEEYKARLLVLDI